MRFLHLTLVLVALASATLAKKSYENYKVYRVILANKEQADILKGFENVEFIDFWTEVRSLDHPVDVMVSPEYQELFTYHLEQNLISFTEHISNVERIVNQERLSQILAPKRALGDIDFVSYQRYENIQKYLARLAKTYPEIVSVESIGKSSHGRSIDLIKISTGGNKPAILVDGGIHAREWISPAMVLYIINQLVENPSNRDMIENVDWLIVPVLNPDGYEYTHTDSRFWRKTLSKGKLCDGVDGNRNFDFHWMETGASSFECAETYAGDKPLSEPETSALADFLLSNKDTIKMYLTFHSYGNYLLYPWGWTSKLPENSDELDKLAHAVNDAIRAVRGTRYTIGSSTNVLYAAAGGSDDYALGVAGVKLAYTIELPGGGSNGFDLPPSKIKGVVEETFEGIKAYHDYVNKQF